MSTLWYYEHDAKMLGPFSQMALKELAAAGTILPMDTVWKEGVEQGVPANQIKNLFPHRVINSTHAIDDALAAIASISASVGSPQEPRVVNDAVAPLEKYESSKAPERPAKKGRATALKGADIVGQDGKYARFRKKCIECGHKDSACHSVLITNKLVKQNYFCPKCRKRREVVIQCQF